MGSKGGNDKRSVCKVNCIRCDKQLKAEALVGNKITYVHGGTAWESLGNYGSQELDYPAGFEFVPKVDAFQVFVCDQCLSLNQGKVVSCVVVVHPVTEYRRCSLSQLREEQEHESAANESES